MTSHNYILNDEGEPQVCEDIVKWGRWFQVTHNRIVGRTDLSNGIRISTVFLGLDHSFNEGPPVLWETMIFGAKGDEYQERYTSREAAILGHAEALEAAKKMEPAAP